MSCLRQLAVTVSLSPLPGCHVPIPVSVPFHGLSVIQMIACSCAYGFLSLFFFVKNFGIGQDNISRVNNGSSFADSQNKGT